MRTRRCDECGFESSIELAKWLGVTQLTRQNEDDPYSRDFCSEKCVASFYMRRTRPTKLNVGTVNVIASAHIPEGEAYFIGEDGTLMSIKLRDEETDEAE